MLVIPFENKFDLKKPPIVTILIIAINCIVFFFYQSNDDDHLMQAIDIYEEGALFEIENPVYSQYLKEGDRDDLALINPDDPDQFYQLILFDAAFSEFLKNYWLHNPDLADAHWIDYRKRFEQARGEISSYSYGLTPADIKPITLLTHQFLHGSLGHLIGNMIFLFIFGFALELLIGKLNFMLIYLLSGFGAAAVYILFSLESYNNLVGASGAISGLVGMYLAAYGLKKINFFYFVGFYFGQFRTSAALMFPYWLAKEIYSQLTSTDNVAYMAHAGGLIAGFTIIYLLKFKGFKIKLDELKDKSGEDNELTGQLEKINQLISELETDRARSLCKRTLDSYPENTEIWKKYYNLWKTEPNNKCFHEVAFNIFKLARFKETKMDFIEDILTSYLSIANKPAALNGPVSLLLAKKFKGTDNAACVEKLVERAMKLKVKDESMAILWNYLSLHFKKQKSNSKANYYSKLVKDNFPHKVLQV